MTKIKLQSPDTPRFSHRWWFNAGRSLFWVTIVTILIWVYADMEFTDEKEFHATIRLTAAKPELILLSRSDVEVTFRVRGNRSRLDSFEGELSGRMNDPESSIVCDVSESGLGNRAIPTTEILSNATGIDMDGLTVLTAEPGAVTVWVDRRIQKELPVELVYSNAELAEQPKVTMLVSVAETRWRKILKKQPNPALKTVNKDLKNEQLGKPLAVEFEIIPLVAGIPVEPAEKSRKLTIEISQRTDSRRIPITVHVLGPASWAENGTWQEYILLRKDPLEWRKQITISGAKKDLDRLRAEAVQAYIVLTDDDKKPVASWLNRQVQIRFPADLKVEILGERPAVQFKLEKRPPATPP